MANELISVPVSTNDSYWQVEGQFDGNGFFFIGYYGGGLNGPENSAIRFLNVAVAQGTTVNYAALVIVVSGVAPADDQNVKYSIHGIDENNTPDFSGGNPNPFSRDKTTASLTGQWSDTSPGSNIAIDVTDMVNEILARPGWSSGNAMGFLLEDNGTATDQTREVSGTGVNCYLAIRVSAEPDFTPEPTTVAAPALPVANDFGIKISRPGKSVFVCPEEDLYFTTRRKTVKILLEDIYISTGAGDITIPHGLGYIPFVTVFGFEVGAETWIRLPVPTYFQDRMTFSINSTNLILHSAVQGEKFYYRILVDKLTD